MLKRAASLFLGSSRILGAARPRLAAFKAIRIGPVVRAYSVVGFKASSIQDSVTINASFKEDHFVLEYLAADKNVQVSKDFPYVWLRDRCRCAKCFNQKTQENDITPFVLAPFDAAPAKVSSDRSAINVTWPNGHESSYELEDLAKAGLLTQIRKQLPHANAPVFWNNQKLVQVANGFPQIDYSPYMTNPAVLNQALESILKYGAVIIKNVPVIEGEIAKVIGRIGPIQSSLYGASYCVVKSNLELIDRAYTSASLMHHTDTTFTKNTAGLEAFHVIEPAPKGGASQIVDGFYCADQLRKLHPQAFEFLANTVVEAEYHKPHIEHMKFRSTMIELDRVDGSFFQVRYNCYDKLNISHLSRADMLAFYDAWHKFSAILAHPDNSHWINLQPDQVIIFNNFRVLHGRSEVTGSRTLLTAYIAFDEWLSKARLRKLID